jgi:hypothetical protein
LTLAWRVTCPAGQSRRSDDLVGRGKLEGRDREAVPRRPSYARPIPKRSNSLTRAWRVTCPAGQSRRSDNLVGRGREAVPRRPSCPAAPRAPRHDLRLPGLADFDYAPRPLLHHHLHPEPPFAFRSIENGTMRLRPAGEISWLGILACQSTQRPSCLTMAMPSWCWGTTHPARCLFPVWCTGTDQCD